MPNYFETSTGEKITQDEIRKRLSHSYRIHDDFTSHCRGCNGQAQGHAHIISQVRCKNLGKADWIWQKWNWFLACNSCNSIWESYKGEKCRKLHNYQQCLSVLKDKDPETYIKYTLV